MFNGVCFMVWGWVAGGWQGLFTNYDLKINYKLKLYISEKTFLFQWCSNAFCYVQKINGDWWRLPQVLHPKWVVTIPQYGVEPNINRRREETHNVSLSLFTLYLHYVLCSVGWNWEGGGISKIIYKISWKKNLVLEKIVLAPSNHFGHPKILFKGFSALKNTFSYLKSFWPQKGFLLKLLKIYLVILLVINKTSSEKSNLNYS